MLLFSLKDFRDSDWGGWFATEISESRVVEFFDRAEDSTETLPLSVKIRLKDLTEDNQDWHSLVKCSRLTEDGSSWRINIYLPHKDLLDSQYLTVVNDLLNHSLGYISVYRMVLNNSLPFDDEAMRKTTCSIAHKESDEFSPLVEVEV